MEVARQKQIKTLSETIWAKKVIEKVRETDPTRATQLLQDLYHQKQKEHLLSRENRRKARAFRLNYCENCYSTENLNAHHINGNPNDNRKENVKTLCKRCHDWWHRI